MIARWPSWHVCTMGTQRGHEDERPPHAVDGFELGVCPVTRAEYDLFVDATKHEPPCEWSHPALHMPIFPSWV